MQVNKNSFMYWMFETRDIDGLVLGIFLSNALSDFTKDLSSGLFKPLIEGLFFRKNKDEKLRFKNKLLMTSLIQLVLQFVLVYVIVKIGMSYTKRK